MKLISAVIFCAFVVQVVLSADNKYTTKYDNVDVDKILNNDRVLTNYIKCLMDEGPCTSEGRELKSEYLQCFKLNFLRIISFSTFTYTTLFLTKTFFS